jgi:hypothetical protein
MTRVVDLYEDCGNKRLMVTQEMQGLYRFGPPERNTLRSVFGGVLVLSRGEVTRAQKLMVAKAKD